MKLQFLKFGEDCQRLLKLRWFYLLSWLCNFRLGRAFGNRCRLVVGGNTLLALQSSGASLGSMLLLMMLLLTDFFGVRDVSWVSHQLIDGCGRHSGRISRHNCSHHQKGETCSRRGRTFNRATPQAQRSIFPGLFFLLTFLRMSAYKLAISIHADRHLLAIAIHNRVVAFLALASLLGDSKNLIATRFSLDGGLRLRRQVLHIYRSFLLSLRRESEARAKCYSCE